MKKIALIGSTGSIGRQTLNVVRRHPDKFKIVSLAAGSNAALLKEQIAEFKPLIASAESAVDYVDEFKNTEFYFGKDAYLDAIIGEADVVVVAVVGFMGLAAVLRAIEKGKDVALANKECLVAGGHLVMDAAKKKGIAITPIDSEHSAIWQSLGCDYNKPFARIILTASGGAFRDLTAEQLKTVTAKEALLHPTWKMGKKITVDCATLVNKGFEIIEAKWLYNTSFDKISVIIHRESIIHSMVEFLDGSVIAQLSYPSMELPIALALSYPDRITSDVKSLNFAEIGKLTFKDYDEKRFPCMNLIKSAGIKGGAYPAVANGANEQAVKLFLEDKISFPDIYRAIDGALSAFSGNDIGYEGLVKADAFAREWVKKAFGD